MQFESSVVRHGARWGSVFTLFVVLASGSVDAAGAAPYKGALRLEPRAISYRYASDTFAHQESSMAALRTTREGGERAYHGNRMTQFKFIGPAGQGGIYDALKNHKDRRPLEVKNYQYRW